MDWELWSEVRATGAWAEALRRGPGERLEERIRKATYAGTPCGDEAFVEELERRAGRRLRPGKPGPKPRATAGAAGS